MSQVDAAACRSADGVAAGGDADRLVSAIDVNGEDAGRRRQDCDEMDGAAAGGRGARDG